MTEQKAPDFQPVTLGNAVTLRIEQTPSVGPASPASAAENRAVSPLIDEAAVFRMEQERVRQRRKALHHMDDGEPATGDRGDNNEPVEDAAGIALSGGGIRSATISLGVLRALGRANLIPRIDYISSVSGGSYVAAFLCSRYLPSGWRGDVEVRPTAALTGGGGDPFAGEDGERALSHLRQSGRHLLPGGAGDLLRLAAITVRSWLAVHLVIGVTLLTALLAIKAPQILWNRYGLVMEAGWASANLDPVLWPSSWAHGYPVAHWFVASWLLPAALIPLAGAVALFWSYFLTRGQSSATGGRIGRALGSPGLWGAMALAVAGVIGFAAAGGSGWPVFARPRAQHAAAGWYALAATAYALAAIGGYALAETVDAARSTGQIERGSAGGAMASARVQEDRVRRTITGWTARWLNAALALAAIGLIDSAAQTIYLRNAELTFPLGAGASLAVVVPLARQLVGRLARRNEASGRLSRALARFGRAIALTVGLAMAAALGVFWAVIAHRIAWFGGPVGELRDSIWFTPEFSYWATLGAAAAATCLVAVSFSFLNLSTFANFYASNLRRAYLGASNVRRWRKEQPPGPGETGAEPEAEEPFAETPPDRDHVDDDVALDRYYAAAVLAPLHLVNVTINDTASKASSTTQRDRRGKPLTLSPAGYLYPRNDVRGRLEGIPLAADQPLTARAGNGADRPREPLAEKLPLSTWIGISGAAASTGMGQYGSVGLSLLAGLANLRLGYWWNPGPARGRDAGPVGNSVQGRLRDELIGRFPGSDGARWYLTDGGHFENTGAYELVRRRVGLIVVCDNGADPGYGFGDLATLARRIRIDFDAELRFADDPVALDAVLGKGTAIRRAFGTLRQLGLADRHPDATGPYAALGRIVYGRPAPADLPDRASSTVIWIKPRVCGAEALDLVAYAIANPPFPQQTTLDQVFSEPQWESHFRLGQVMGDRLFAVDQDAPWCPASMTPLPDSYKLWHDAAPVGRR